MARSLERVWEERLRRAEQIEQEHDAWRRDQVVSIDDDDRQEILALGEDLPRLWRAATTRSADRKQIVRLVIKEVTLDQKQRLGYVWIKIIWQTGAVSEHWLQRHVQSYAQYADQDRLRQRIAELNGLQKIDNEVAEILNKEAFRTAHGPALLWQDDSSLTGKMAHTDRQDQRYIEPPAMVRWQLLGRSAAAIIGITPQTIFDWLRKGWLTGKQLAKGMPWQISLSPERVVELKARIRRTTRLNGEAS